MLPIRSALFVLFTLAATGSAAAETAPAKPATPTPKPLVELPVEALVAVEIARTSTLPKWVSEPARAKLAQIRALDDAGRRDDALGAWKAFVADLGKGRTLAELDQLARWTLRGGALAARSDLLLACDKVGFYRELMELIRTRLALLRAARASIGSAPSALLPTVVVTSDYVADAPVIISQGEKSYTRAELQAEIEHWESMQTRNATPNEAAKNTLIKAMDQRSGVLQTISNTLKARHDIASGWIDNAK